MRFNIILNKTNGFKGLKTIDKFNYFIAELLWSHGNQRTLPH